MKKTIIACFTGILLTWTITSVSYSQIPNSTVKPGASHEEFISTSEEINAAKNPNPVVSNEISTKAVKNFTKSYKNAPNAKWCKLKDGFVACFTCDGIKTSAFYNNRGNFEVQIRDYYEDKLPREIRHLVKSTYYDFSIYYINEFSADGIIVYLVKIEDKTSFKTIKVVAGGEMEVVEEYFKN